MSPKVTPITFEQICGLIKRQVTTKFHGTLNMSFQNGIIGNVKESNALALGWEFNVLSLDKVLVIIKEWINSKHFGTIEIPFQHGAVGKPKECRVIKAGELSGIS